MNNLTKREQRIQRIKLAAKNATEKIHEKIEEKIEDVKEKKKHSKQIVKNLVEEQNVEKKPELSPEFLENSMQFYIKYVANEIDTKMKEQREIIADAFKDFTIAILNDQIEFIKNSLDQAEKNKKYISLSEFKLTNKNK